MDLGQDTIKNIKEEAKHEVAQEITLQQGMF